eukprot:7389203-Prymnesium_polylepis.1
MRARRPSASPSARRAATLTRRVAASPTSRAATRATSARRACRPTLSAAPATTSTSRRAPPTPTSRRTSRRASGRPPRSSLPCEPPRPRRTSSTRAWPPRTACRAPCPVRRGAPALVSQRRCLRRSCHLTRRSQCVRFLARSHTIFDRSKEFRERASLPSFAE